MVKTALQDSLIQLIKKTLSLSDNSIHFTPQTLLLGHIPELDSMSIASLILSMEETFKISIPDEDLSAECFESIESLTNFIHPLLNAHESRVC